MEPKIMLLNEIRNRGFLNVGTDSSVNADNSYAADFNTDLGKGIAAAVFGDANKIKFVSVAFEDSFTSVKQGNVDLVSSGVTQNLGRDGSLGIDFAPTYLYDYQAILVNKDSKINNILELEGKTIGTVKGTTASDNLTSILGQEGIEFTPQVFASNADMLSTYNQGKIDAISSDRTDLFANLNKFSDPDNHLILDTGLSKQPLALVIPENDSEWGDVVKWTTYALIQAEEFGITSA
ncbi:MAG: transporter substrate-binding domain-containing protein, partial [Hydrococcus sp. SU_1_0]|nr:transporter substrate-binding domain-containing protein [Hydrococcus sp. SU_1_0]